MSRRFAVALAAVALLAAAPSASAARVTTLHLGDSLTVSGRTGSLPGRITRAVGLVVVRARWNGGRLHVLTTTRTDRTGRYHLRVRPRRRGLLVLRVQPPDRHEQRFTIRVL